MSIEKLQEKIRKMKNPIIADLTIAASDIPPSIWEKESDPMKATSAYAMELLNALKGKIPAVRFSYPYYSLLGADGINNLMGWIHEAKKSGFYVLLDLFEGTSPAFLQLATDRFCDFPCDGFIITAYSGSDVIQPYVKQLKQSGKSLFVVIRGANKSASQIQDLMTGSRLAHMTTADVVKRLGEAFVGRSGYSQVAGVCAATSPNSIRMLREKYKNVFLLVDGIDYSGGNAKNCSLAFDRLGHGAAVCASESVVGAWQESGMNDPIAAAADAVERLRKNILKYITVL